MTGRVAVIAGTGRLARAVVAALDAPIVAALDGFAPDNVSAEAFRLERLVPFLDSLTDRGVTQVVFAGAVRRPRLDPELFDARTATLVPRIVTAMRQGDDAALREVVLLFEEAGLQVVAVADVVPDLVPGAGILAGRPESRDRADTARAAEIVAGLGALDIGQGAVVRDGLAVAVETLPGTEAMLAFAALHRDAGGVLYKAPKPGQERRIDLPAIGPETVAQAAAAGLGGIAWEAGGVMLIDRAETVARAEAAGLFLWARDPADPCACS